jgi:diadenosine tetraphosphatase ApaH/serine/threonine PP2A family protein phosphatase
VRYAIVSDLHANLESTQAVFKQINAMDIDQVVCLGDVVGYNANPNECIEMIREHTIPTVCGNHDAVSCGLEEPWGFNPIALSAALWTREALNEDNTQWLRELPVNIEFDHFLAAHGSPTDRDTYLFTWEDVLPHFPYLEERNQRLCFFGHTHCPGIFSCDGMYSLDADSRFTVPEDKTFFINCGSVGQPRDGDPRASFGVYDSDTRVYELVRVEYSIQTVADRIVSSELPNFLAERLFLGR